MLQDEKKEHLPGSCLMGREEAKRSGVCICHFCEELAALWEGVCCYGRKAVILLLRVLGLVLVTARTLTPKVDL